MAMFIFARKIINGEPIQVFNHGNMKRDFTYIDDIVAGTRSAIDKNYKYEVFNLGNHRSEHLMDVIKLLEKYINKKAKIEYLPMQPGDIPVSYANIQKSEELLGYNPRINVNVGVKRFVKFYTTLIEIN